MADQSMDLDEEPKAPPSPDTEGENSLEQFTSPVVTNDNQGSQDPASAAPAATPPPAPTAAPAKAQLPTWDEAVAGKKPTWDEAVSQHQQGSLLEAFNPFQGNQALSEAQRGWFQKQPMWNVVSAFGKGFADTIDKEAPLDKETIDSLNKSGTLEEFQKFGNISNQSIMDAYVIPYTNNLYKSWSFMANAFSDNFTAGALQIGKAAFVATPEALIAGSKAALEEFDKQDGGTFGETVINTVEAANEASAFGGFLNAAGVIGAETGFARALGMAGRDIPPLPPEVAAAKAAGAMESEGVFTGAKEPTPEQAKAMQDAANMYPDAYAAYHDEAPVAPKAEGAPEAPKTIHDVAREVDPVTFSQYDALRVRQDSYRQWYSDLRDKRAAEAEVAAPHADEIADLKDQLANNPGNARSASRKQSALDRLVQERQDFIDAAKKVETPDMATLRKALQNTDYGVRDLATRVGAAYREAETRMPPAPVEEAVAAVETATKSAPEVAENTPQVEPLQEKPQTPPAAPTSITDKVSRDLVAAGRPQEEAEAHAALIDAHYQARSERFGGKLGTAEEMYEKDAAEVRAASGTSTKYRGGYTRATSFAKAVIRLFKEANASTFIHETGHHWLEELLSDAKHPEAPADLVKDSETVKKWLGVGEDGKITTVMHEKFARGMERKMIEGVSPSRALDGVFEKFKGWLNQIYTTARQRTRSSPINDDIRDVFDRLLTNKPEKAVIAPEVPETKVPPMPELPLEAAAKEPLPPDHPEAPYVKPPPPAPLPVSKTPFKNPLLKWLADMGGVKIGSDVDQALRELGIAPGQKGTPVGFFKKKTETAASIDNIPVREFNDKFDTHYPDTDTGYMNRQDVVDAIRDEAFGKKLGSEYEKTAAEVEAARAADLKNEVFDHAKGMGVEGLTNGDVDAIATAAGEGGDLKAAIFNRLEETGKLTDALSEEQRAHEAAQFAEYFAEQHGIHIDDDVNSRLFEDAENDYRPGEDQEDAGRPNANDAESQGSAGNGGGQAGVSEPSKQGERGSGASLFSDAEGSAGDAAKSAADRDADAKRDADAFTSRPDTHWVDPAGNIRVENLASEEDVREAMRSVARDNNEFMEARRGVVTDDEVNRLAADMGVAANEINIQKLRQMSLEDGIPMAVRIKAGRMMLKEIATAAVNAMAKYAATGLDADLLALEEVRSRHFTVANTVAAVTAEWGRAGRAFRDISEAQKESEEAIGELFQRMTGQTPAQVRRMAKLGAGLDDAGKVSKFLNDSIKPSFGAWIIEYWTNSLISGIATHTTYMVGNELLALWKAIPETLAASAIGKIHEALGHEVSGIRAGEVGAQLKARVASIPGALSAAGTAAKTGVTTLLPGENLATTDAALFPAGGVGLAERSGNEHVTWKELGADMWGTIRGLRDSIVATGQLIKAGGVEGAPAFKTRPSSLGAIPDIAIKGVQIPVGNIARIPSRAVAAIHSYFRFSDYSMSKAAIAYRTASNEGLAGEAFAARVADGMVNPSHEVMQQSIGTATDLTLMGRGGAVTKAISRFTNLSVNLPGLGETKLLKFVDPFVSISSNILSESLVKRTPLGLLSSAVREDLLGKNGAVARDEAQARMVVGSAFAVTIGGLAAEGLVSGSGPSDPRQNAAWRMLGGNQPHSVRIGDIWYDTHRLGPLGMLIGVGADLHEVSDKISKGDATAASSALMFAIAQNVLDESWMRGPSELIRALTDHERYGDAYVRNFVSSLAVPFSVGMSQMARAHDPYARQARTVMDAIKNKIPGQSEDLFPRRDVWGEPIANKDVLGEEGFSAIYEQRINHDPVNQALLKVGKFPSQPQRKIRGVELNDQQYDDYSRISGRLMKQRLNNIVAQEGFASIPDAQKIQVIKKIMDASRETARKIIMMKNPEIMRQAVQKKNKSVQR